MSEKGNKNDELHKVIWKEGSGRLPRREMAFRGRDILHALEQCIAAPTAVREPG
jgi:hypothetical protein